MTKASEGRFQIDRKLYQSKIWRIKHPIYLKVWIWLIGQANHGDRNNNGFQYKRGEIVTTYKKIILNASYYENNRRVTPTIKQIRVILDWLKSENMIEVNPLKTKDNHSKGRPFRGTGADTRAEAGAYVGLKILVINYDSYQFIIRGKGRHRGRGLKNEQGHDNNNDYNNNKTERPSLSVLKSRYKNQSLINETFRAIASIRKSNRVEDSVLTNFLSSCEKYSVLQVMEGMRIYLEKNYCQQGKGERYLLGIIRGQVKNGMRSHKTDTQNIPEYLPPQKLEKEITRDA